VKSRAELSPDQMQFGLQYEKFLIDLGEGMMKVIKKPGYRTTIDQTE
jgi:hypothetical protein